MISAADPDRIGALCRRMLKSTIRKGSGPGKKTGHMLTVDKHRIPFTGADRCNYSFIISGKPKCGTYQI